MNSAQFVIYFHGAQSSCQQPWLIKLFDCTISITKQEKEDKYLFI